jgi:predicted Zn-dependent protease
MVDYQRLESLRRMAEKNPDNALARFGLANELLKAELWEEAERELAAYLARHDDEGNGWLRMVDLLRRLGRTGDAREAIDRGMDAARRHSHNTLVMEFEARLEELDEP